MTGQAISDDKAAYHSNLANLGRIAALRPDLREILPLVDQASRDSILDWRVTGAVVSVEMLGRGGVARRMEFHMAKALLALGRESRALTMTLGLPQLRLSLLVKDGLDIEQAIEVASEPRSAIIACFRHLEWLCYELKLGEPAASWASSDWRRLSAAYSGGIGYGEAVRCAYHCLNR